MPEGYQVKILKNDIIISTTGYRGDSKYTPAMPLEEAQRVAGSYQELYQEFSDDPKFRDQEVRISPLGDVPFVKGISDPYTWRCSICQGN